MLCRGFQFVADAPNTNAIGQQVLYFDTTTTLPGRAQRCIICVESAQELR